MKIVEVLIDKIKPDPNQPRQTVNDGQVEELAISMKKEGVINPIEIDKDNVIITGEQRWKAARLAGLKKVPCKIISINLENRFRRQVVENLQHNAMTAWDTAQALAKLLNLSPGNTFKGGRGNEGGISELSRQIGKSRQFIMEHLELTHTSERVQKALAKNKVPMAHLRALKETPVPYQKRMEEKILAGEFNSRDVAMKVASALRRAPSKAASILEKDYSKCKYPWEIINTLEEIAPTPPSGIQKNCETYNEFSKLSNSLREWLKANPSHTILSSMFGLSIIMSLEVLSNEIDTWGKLSQAVEDPANTDEPEMHSQSLLADKNPQEVR